MKLLSSFPVTAYAVILMGIVAFCVASQSVGLLLVAGVLAALSWYLTEGPRSRSLPLWTSNVLVVAVALNVLVDFFYHRNDLPGVLGRLIIWLVLIKLYRRKGPRDYAQLLSLSLLLVLLGCVKSADLLFAAVLLVYAAVGLYALLGFQLYASYERTRAARLEALPRGLRHSGSLQPVFGRRTALHFRTLTVAIAAAGLLASTTLFVLFPRDFGHGFLGTDLAASTKRSGFSGIVNLMGSTRITESRKAVLTLTLPEGPRRLHRPLLLRGAVLDHYDGRGRWTASVGSPRRLIKTLRGEFAQLGTAEAAPGPTLTQQIELLSPSQTLFSVYAPVSIATADAHSFRMDPVTLTIHHAGTRRLRRYTIKAQPAPSDVTLRKLTYGESSNPITRQFRDVHPRIKALARDLLEAAELPEKGWRYNREAARVLAEYLRTGPFTYLTDLRDITLPSGDGPEGDPIFQFLFETRRGHCEYFASALAALCNCVGIPARLVTGYVALEYDEGRDRYIVRESNAHAWVETKTGPDRWTAVDPTPPATLLEIHGSGNGVFDRLHWIFDRFEATWHNGFVAFDRHSQLNLTDTLNLGWSQRFADTLAATRIWMARVNRAFYLGWAGYIWMGIVALALVIAVIALAKQMRRTSRIRSTLRLESVTGGEHQRMLRQLGFYLDMLVVLEKSGCPKPWWQPPLDFARVLAHRHPEPAAAVTQITELFYGARYGREPLSRRQMTRARSLVESLRGQMVKTDSR